MFKTLLNSRKIITEKPCQGITKRVLELFEISDTRTTLCRNIPILSIKLSLSQLKQMKRYTSGFKSRTNTVASAPALTDPVFMRIFR